MIKRLSTEESLALLSASRLARLGCNAGDYPYVVPVNYVYDDGAIIVHSLPGKKIEAMRADPRVCVQVDRITDHLGWASVIAYGRYQEITDAQARERALARLFAAFPALTPVESVAARGAAQPPPVVFHVLIDMVTGVREG